MAMHLTENVKIRLDTDTLREFERLAKEGDRSVAAEMRRALRAYIAQATETEEDAA